MCFVGLVLLTVAATAAAVGGIGALLIALRWWWIRKRFSKTIENTVKMNTTTKKM